MKKLFIIFLLMVLPFQYSWAAAAAYCQHEKEPTTHFGHHSHQHQDVAQNSTETAEDESDFAQVHSDCGVCQFAGQASFLTTLPKVFAPPGAFTVLPLFVSFTSHIAEGPQRPDRHLVA